MKKQCLLQHENDDLKRKIAELENFKKRAKRYLSYCDGCHVMAHPRDHIYFTCFICEKMTCKDCEEDWDNRTCCVNDDCMVSFHVSCIKDEKCPNCKS